MKLRIALVSIGPRSIHAKAPNFGLLYITAYLQKTLGLDPADVLLIDQCAGDDVLETLTRNEWDIAGFSASSISAHQLNQIVPEVRRRWPNRVTVLGGVHVSALPEIALRQSCAHFGVQGDGERAFAEIVSGLAENGEAPRNIPGLVWLENDVLNSSGVSVQPVEDLDSLPPLPLHILNRDFYFKHIYPPPGTTIPAFPWITSRGCVFKCRFCATNAACGAFVRYQSPDRVIEDLERLVRDYGVRAIYFWDDNLVANRPRLEAICKALTDRPSLKNLRWTCNARADRVDEDLLRTMKRAGCVQVAFGFESGSQRILTYLKKGPVTVEDGRRAAQSCRKVGLRVMGTFMVGNPGETREDIEQTFAFIRSTPIDFVLVFTTQPAPGSELWDLAVERRIIDPNTIDWRTIMYDQKPLLADSVDPEWLYRRFRWEVFRSSLHNYSLPRFVFRAARALYLNVAHRSA